jgi:hypothetical protein
MILYRRWPAANGHRPLPRTVSSSLTPKSFSLDYYYFILYLYIFQLLQVAFQHNGLVQNQGKFESESKAVELHQANHATRVSELEAFLHQSRRRKIKHAKKTESTTAAPMQMLQVQMDHHNANAARWPVIFRNKSQSLHHAMAEEKTTISGLERVMAGYEKYFPEKDAPSSLSASFK